MNRGKRLATVTLLVTLAIAGHSHAQGPTRADLLVGSCFGCHGTDGNSPGSIPSLAGKSPDFIEQAMRGFRAGARPATVMTRHATGYSDEEIRLIADYFAAQ
jgi:sulfide dehydrogenase cytochrome subunit